LDTVTPYAFDVKPKFFGYYIYMLRMSIRINNNFFIKKALMCWSAFSLYM